MKKNIYLFITLLPFVLFFSYSYLRDLNLKVLNNDYSDLHLGHAISMELWVNNLEEKRSGYFHTTHPGYLFQLSSYIVFLINKIINNYSNSIDAINFTLKNSNLFFSISFFLSNLLNILMILFINTKVKNLKKYPFLNLILILPLTIRTELDHTFLHFTNDYFSLILCILIIYYLDKFPYLNKNLYIFHFPLLFAMIYLNKLPYIIWFISFILSIILINSPINQKLFNNILKIITLVLFFIIYTTIFSITMWDLDGLIKMLSMHISLLLGSGRMGNGGGIINYVYFLSNLKIFALEQGLFFIILLYTIVIIFLVLWVNFNYSYKYRSILLFSILSFSLGFIAVFKHYGANYILVPMAAVVPGLIILYNVRIRNLYLSLIGLIFLCLYNNVRYNYTYYENLLTISKNYNIILDSYSKNNIGSNFVEEYRAPSNSFTVYHSLFCSDIKFPEFIYRSIYGSNIIIYNFESNTFNYNSNQKNIKSYKFWISTYSKNGYSWFSKNRESILNDNFKEYIFFKTSSSPIYIYITDNIK